MTLALSKEKDLAGRLALLIDEVKREGYGEAIVKVSVQSGTITTVTFTRTNSVRIESLKDD